MLDQSEIVQVWTPKPTREHVSDRFAFGIACLAVIVSGFFMGCLFGWVVWG